MKSVKVRARMKASKGLLPAGRKSLSKSSSMSVGRLTLNLVTYALVGIKICLLHVSSVKGFNAQIAY
jgi:hypothetical protein